MNIYTSNNSLVSFLLGKKTNDFVYVLLTSIIGSFLLAIQFYNPFLYVPNTNIPYPISFELNNYIIVAFTIISLGAITSAWVTSSFNKNINKRLIV